MSTILNQLLRFTPKVGKVGVGLLIAAGSFVSCSDMDEYFEKPEWLRGSIYETLQNDGNYSQFLAGVNKLGWSAQFQGKSILTIMAPTDEAMAEYLSKYHPGVSSITDLPDVELKKLIGFHTLYYSFDKDMLMNYHPGQGDGISNTEKAYAKGMYYKFRTMSQDAPTDAKKKIINDAVDPPVVTYKDIKVAHPERYVPVFSSDFFNYRQLDAATNYNYFFPGMWRGDGGFNVANAAVDEYAVKTSNGYIYRIGSVLRPLETINTELKNRPEFSRYYNMYDAYSDYVYDDDLSKNLGTTLGIDSLYMHRHDGLADIACEWPVGDPTKFESLSSIGYSVFAFTNQAIESFFNDYWKEGGYASLDDEQLQESLKELLMNSYTEVYIPKLGDKKDSHPLTTLSFPQDFAKGRVFNYSSGYNNPAVINLNTDAVKQENRIVCSNGLLYGSDYLIPPAKYNAVTGPAFQRKDFSKFRGLLNFSGQANTLTLQNVQYIMLFPSDDLLAEYELNAAKTAYVDKNNVRLDATKTVYTHFAQCDDGQSLLPVSSQVTVKETFCPDPKIFWFIKDGKLTNSVRYTEKVKYLGNNKTDDDIWVNPSLLSYRGDPNGWTNGHAYTYEMGPNAQKPFFLEGTYTNSTYSNAFGLLTGNMAEPTNDFYAWIQLLNKAGMISGGGMIYRTELTLMFVPKTNALEQAIIDGKIPGAKVAAGTTVGDPSFFNSSVFEVTDKAALETYLKSYFVPQSTASTSIFPYVGWGESTVGKGLITLDQDDMDPSISTVLNIYDDGSKLTVSRKPYGGTESAKVSVSGDYDYLPLIYQDCVMHFIDDILPATELPAAAKKGFVGRK